MNDISKKNNPATSRQLWAIFVKTGFDVRGCNLTWGDVTALLNGEKQAADFPGARQVRKESAPKQDWQLVYVAAHEAGMAAGVNAVCVPMVVQEHANPLNDSSPVIKTYAPVMDGVCGFSYSVIKPATHPFVKWLKEQKIGRSHYGGGYAIWCHQFNQSMTRKEAYCAAFCEVLNRHGIKAYYESRMD